MKTNPKYSLFKNFKTSQKSQIKRPHSGVIVFKSIQKKRLSLLSQRSKIIQSYESKLFPVCQKNNIHSKINYQQIKVELNEKKGKDQKYDYNFCKNRVTQSKQFKEFNIRLRTKLLHKAQNKRFFPKIIFNTRQNTRRSLPIIRFQNQKQQETKTQKIIKIQKMKSQKYLPQYICGPWQINNNTKYDHFSR